MEPEIRVLPEKKLIGKSRVMSYTNNITGVLWQSFMLHRKTIVNTVGSDLYAMQIYNSDFDFNNFNAQEKFTKWAAIEVEDFETIPDNLETYLLKGGLYAVFSHKGNTTKFHKTFAAIFSHWLPKSNYVIDNREHFELLGEKYSTTNPDSEEQIWVPIQLKK